MLKKRAVVTPSGARKLRRTNSIPRRPNYAKVSLSRSMTAPQTHTFIRSANINIQGTTAGFSWNVGVTPSANFSIWFTQQDAYIWSNASNYSTVSIPGYTDLAALFDEVKIAAVEMCIMSGPDAANYGTSVNGSASLMLSTDYNDKNAPTSLGDVQQYADCRTVMLANGYVHKEIIRPKFLTYSLDSAGTAVASTPKRGYTRSNLAVEHYGIKGSFLLLPPANSAIVFTFKFKYICKVQK